MRVLIACEFSGVVREAFRKRGHAAWSCDILPAEDDSEFHLQADVLNVTSFGWDMMIAFPPCTHLAVSGAAWFKEKIKDGRQQAGIDFFISLVKAPIYKIAIENPVGIMSNKYRCPDQIIQPYYFGDEFQKTTCLWLENLPPLFHAKEADLFNHDVTHVDKGEFKEGANYRVPKWFSDNKNAKIRSKTLPGIASAMAEQWG